jgi:hypothetical protein
MQWKRVKGCALNYVSKDKPWEFVPFSETLSSIPLVHTSRRRLDRQQRPVWYAEARLSCALNYVSKTTP